MINLTLPILGEFHASILMLVVNWIIGWFIIERIRLWREGKRTEQEWNNQFTDDSCQ